MDASALDLIVKPLADGESWTHEFYAQAQADLAALRARVDDLELIARACTRELDGSSAYYVCNAILHGRYEGQPLTAEARRALRGENEGKVST